MERLETLTNGGLFVWGYVMCGNNTLSREKGHRQCFGSSFERGLYETGEFSPCRTPVAPPAIAEVAHTLAFANPVVSQKLNFRASD